MLVDHIEGFRRVWMVPRNIRKIEVWKIYEILVAIKSLVNSGSNIWDQKLQDTFISDLDNKKIKDCYNSRDPHSGGARTYLSQLEALGLIFKRGKEIYLTLAGESITKGEDSLSILQSQLLKFQYPSTYSEARNVGIHKDIKIKPFLFLLRLMYDPEIGYLNQKEMVIPIVYGHSIDSYGICKIKIKRLRESNNLKSVFNNIFEDAYTVRNQEKTDFNKKFAFLMDIANTFKNYLESVFLIQTIEDFHGEKKYALAGSTSINVVSEFNNLDKFLNYDSEYKESFQRKYGLWGAKKDIRKLPSSSKKLQNSTDFIIYEFFYYLGHNLVTSEPTAFINELNVKYGFSKKIIRDKITPLLDKSLTLFSSKYLELAEGGVSTALDFEKATGEIFRKYFGFIVEETGQKKRKGHGGYSDLLLTDQTTSICGIVDTKATKNYTLSDTDFRKMVTNYIPNYHELIDDNSIKLKFCLYVAGNFGGRYLKQLESIYLNTKIPASAISALDLLKWGKSIKDVTKRKEIISRLCSGGRLTV